MIKKDVLDECEKLSYLGRAQFMYSLGCSAATHAPAQDAIKELLDGSLYERALGLQTCYGSRDAKPALEALRSPSYYLKSKALPLIALHATDEEVLDILHLIPFKLKVAFIRRLRKRRRSKLIDVIVNQLAVSKIDDRLYKTVLPLASASLVESGLPQVLDRFEASNWTALFKKHPDIACKSLRTWILQAKSPDWLLRGTVNNLLPRMAETKATRHMALDIAKSMLNLVPLRQLTIQNLLRRCPRQVAQLVLESKEQMHQTNADFTLVAKSLSTEQLLALYEKHPNTVPLRCFFKLKPHQRLAVYEKLRLGWQDAMGKIPPEIVGALPTKERIREARRHLSIPDFETDPFLTIDYAAFLPWKEALETQAPFIRSNDADTRSAALSSQIATTRYEKEHRHDALELLLKRRFEQDPVRNEMLSALQKLPPGSWKEEHLPDLAIIIRNNLDMSDTSCSTIQVLLTILTRLLLFHPAWSAKQLALIIQEREQVLTRFQMSGNSSIKNAMSFFADAMSPVLKTWCKKGKDNLLWQFANALEEKLQYLPELLDVLEQILPNTSISSVTAGIIERLIKHKSQCLSSLVPALLELDTSFFKLSIIRDYVHTHLQNLLTPYLSPITYEGRFSSGKRPEILDIYNGFQKWTNLQQEALAQTLVGALKELDRPVTEAQEFLRQLGGLCFMGHNPLIDFASDERPVVQESALRILSNLDAGQGIPTLVEALDDRRARIAIYALRKALNTMPELEALNILVAVPLTKVTVAKEVLRLIGESGSNEAYQYLRKTEGDKLHPDVRVALLRGLWSYLEHPETWAIFERAAQDPDPSVAASMAKIPLSGVSTQARGSLLQVTGHLLGHPAVKVRLSALFRCFIDPPNDPHQNLTPRILNLLQSPLRDEIKQAAQAFFSMYHTTEATLITNTFRGLLKDRWRLTIVFDAYINRHHSDHQRMIPTTCLILNVLKSDPLSLSMRLRLIFKYLPWQALRQELLDLGPNMHADALVKAEALVEELPRRPDINLMELELDFENSDDEKIRRLALSALLARSKRVVEGWTDELRERLQVYQEDQSPLVAEAANSVFPPVRTIDVEK